jgi:(p)ppGpp synthase/HD superfamily hydrolase
LSTQAPRVASLSSRFDDAFLYAHEAHRNQRRKKTDRPYVSHLLGVASLVLQYGGDEEQAIAALLHDVVEDCGGAPRLEEIRRKFGQRVARIVDGCTDSDQTPKPPWRERKEGYLQRVRREDTDVLLISAADKLYNVREILMDLREHGPGIWERFTGRREGSLWYYRALVEAFRGRAPRPLVDELERVVAELERLG